MAKIGDINQPGYVEWLAEQPPEIRALAERLPPDRLYRLSPTGQRVTIAAYSEDGTVIVNITGQYNLCDFSRSVFGIDPANLTECDLPEPGEPLGAILRDPDNVEAYIAQQIRKHDRIR